MTGLADNSRYFFAVKTVDESGNISQLSNIALETLGDVIPPDPIYNLFATPGNRSGEIVLAWTATGDDQNIGHALSYELRSSMDPIRNAQDFFSATVLATAQLPKEAGSPESLTLTLSPGVTYYLALRTFDDAGNSSDVSNIETVFSPRLSYLSIKEFGKGILSEPRGLSLDSGSGRLYVADSGSHKVHIFDGQFYQSSFDGGGAFYRPVDVAVTNNALYVLDAFKLRKYSRVFNAGTERLDFGSEVGGFVSPGGLGVDSSDNVYVADTNRERIVKFDKDLIFLREWNYR